MSDDPVLIRQVTAGDLPYIMATWLRDLRDADPGALPDDLWFPAHRALIERLLATPGIEALVACAADAPNEILGYIVARPNEALLWVQVRKGPLRGRGIARKLLVAAKCGEGLPSAWGTPDSRKRLHNPPRGRLLRRTAWMAGRSAS